METLQEKFLSQGEHPPRNIGETFDHTELFRREIVSQINSRIQSEDAQNELVRLREIHGENNVWDTQGLQQEFEVQSFMAPFCIVKRKSDNKRGVVMFQHSPRFYFGFAEQ